MQVFVKPAISFLAQSHQELQKKRIIQRNVPLRTVTTRNNPLSMYSQISQILDETLSSVTCPLAIEGF